MNLVYPQQDPPVPFPLLIRRLVTSHKQPQPFCSCMTTAFSGQFFLQALHSVHRSGLGIVNFPVSDLTGRPNGQTSAQIPQPVQAVSLMRTRGASFFKSTITVA